MSSTHQVRPRLTPDKSNGPHERGAAAEQVRRAMAQLTRRQAQIVGLVYTEHLTQKQAAVRLRMSQKRVRREIATALQRLAAILERTETT